VIGDVLGPDGSAIRLAERLWEEIGGLTGLTLIDFIADELGASTKVSRMLGETKGQATERDCVLVLARDDGTPYVDGDDIDWSEPYKDGGPDAAYVVLRRR
jgi:site-specific DNA-methyltransferase (adenine-specific)